MQPFGFIIGIIYGLYFKESIAFYICLIFILFVLIGNKNSKLIKINTIFLLISTAIISNFYINILENSYKSVCNESIYSKAIISSNVKETEYNYVYIIKILEGKYKNKKMILYVTKEDKIFEYGTVVRLNGKCEIPKETSNYKGFNYKQYLKQKKIYGIVCVKQKNVEILKENNFYGISAISYIIKQKIIEKISFNLPDKTKNLCIGILIGEDSNLQEEIVTSFQKSSLSHILAVSGSHISYIIFGITYLANTIQVNKKVGNIFTILVLVIFMFITNFSESVIRACIMGIVFLGSKIFYRKNDTIICISISILLMLIYNPYSLQNAGLQLSFLGVLGILIFNKKINNILVKRIPPQIAQLISVTLSAQIFILPVIMVQFNTLSLTFVLSNLLAVPISGMIVIVGFFAIILPFKSTFLLVNILLEVLIFISDIMSKISISNIKVVTPSMFLIIVYYILITLNSLKITQIKMVLIILIRKKLIKSSIIKKLIIEKRVKKVLVFLNKVLILFLIAVFIVNKLIVILPNNLRIYFVDVGQGDCTLIKTYSNKIILIDGGGAENENYDIGQKILVPYLLDRQVKKIDYMIASHFDSDHIKGLLSVAQSLVVKNIIISKQGEITQNYEEFIKIVKEKQINVIIVKAGDKIKIDKDTILNILWPEKEQVKENVLNNNSIVAQLVYKNFSMLFTGDIEEVAEERIIEKNFGKLKSTVLKVAHHGSKTSTSDKFLKLVTPFIALIGAGEGNSFGHPNVEILERIENINAKIYRTDINGEIELKITNKGTIKVHKTIDK